MEKNTMDHMGEIEQEFAILTDKLEILRKSTTNACSVRS